MNWGLKQERNEYGGIIFVKNVPLHGRNHHDKNFKSLTFKMFNCVFENFQLCLWEFSCFSFHIRLPQDFSFRDRPPDPSDFTELPSPSSMWGPVSGAVSPPHWSLDTTYGVIWETPIEIVPLFEERWIYRETWGHTWRAGPSTLQAKDEQLCKKKCVLGHRRDSVF